MTTDQIQAQAAKLFKGTASGAAETHRLADQFGREVDVTWRGEKLAGVKYATGNAFIPADRLGQVERERWATPPRAQVRKAA